MTRISLLQDQKANFEAQVLELKDKRDAIYAKEQQAITDVISLYFQESDFSKEVEIEVTRGSVYFKMAHPDYSYKKELFSIYLKENWNFDKDKNTKSFDGVDLSYYTTSTKGIDKWELKRLQLLGVVAEIILHHQEKMLELVNAAVLPFREEYDQTHAPMNLLRNAIRDIDERIAVLEKEKIAFDLKKDGVEFDKGFNIQLKYNYSPYVKSIKLIDFSKSGKKATAVFSFVHGEYTSREENINVQSIIDQVYGLRKNIVEKELLTSQ